MKLMLDYGGVLRFSSWHDDSVGTLDVQLQGQVATMMVHIISLQKVKPTTPDHTDHCQPKAQSAWMLC